MALGHGTLSLFLSAEAKVLSIFWVEKISEGIELIVPEPLSTFTRDLIEKYHFAEKFETLLEDTAVPAKNEAAFARMAAVSEEVLKQPLVFAAQLDDLCDADKGCYIGQEIVERVRSRKRKS